MVNQTYKSLLLGTSDQKNIGGGSLPKKFSPRSGKVLNSVLAKQQERKSLDALLQEIEAVPNNTTSPNSSAVFAESVSTTQSPSLDEILHKMEASPQVSTTTVANTTSSSQDTSAHTSGGTHKIIDELKEKKPSSKNLSQAFKADQEKTKSPLGNFQLVILATFGLGILAFGVGQFIRNANLNFASENEADSNAITSPTDASPPRILSFQGRLSMNEGEVMTSPKQMQFALYDTSGGNTPPPTGGNEVWTSGKCAVTLDQTGFFAVSLGAGQGDNNDNDACGGNLGNVFSEHGALWLQITVEEEVLFPRQLVKSVPYALNSETLQGFPASTSATANTIPVVNESGNLVFNTQSTSLINSGDLALHSLDGSIYLLPGGGNVHVGSDATPSGLIVHGDATISGNLDIGGSIDTVDHDLQFRTRSSQDLSDTVALTLTQEGKLGIGTTSPSQKLSINQGNIGFDYLKAPAVGDFQATENDINPQGLTYVTSPQAPLATQLDGETGALTSGIYSYGVTFVTYDGIEYRETTLGNTVSLHVNADNVAVLLSDIPTYPADNVVARKIYRTAVDAQTPYLLHTLNDNLTTSFIDTTAQNSSTVAPNQNHTGAYRYKVTYVTDQGETNPSEATPVVVLSGNGRTLKLENIPTDSSGRATARKIYRTAAGGQTYRIVATIPDNTTTTLYDQLADENLFTHRLLNDYNSTSGGIYAGSDRIIQFSDDGKIIADGEIIAQGRVETSHGDSQGLKLPTSVGKPIIKVGQQIGDIVYDVVSGQLYIYNGQDFISQGTVANSNNPSPSPEISGQNGSGCNGNNCQIVIEPEYAGAVITTDGINNQGDLVADHEVTSDNQHFNYYLWQSSTATVLQTVDILLSLTLPNDFESWQSSAFTLDFATNTTDPTNNNIAVTFYKNGGGEFLSSDNTSSQATQWMSKQKGTTPLTIGSSDLSSLDLQAGDKIIIKITAASENNHFVKLGKIALNYQGNQGVSTANNTSYWHKLAGALFIGDDTNQVFFGGTSIDNAKIAMLGLGGSDTPTLSVSGNIFLGGNNDNYLDIAASNRFAIRTGDNLLEAITILPNGNVGIGNPNPQEKLDVVGNATISGTLSLSPISSEEAGACDLTSEGKIYYDREAGDFFACKALDQQRTSFAWSELARSEP